MIDGILAWLSEIDGKVSITLLPLVEPKSGLDWSAIFSTFVGASATIVAVFLAIWLGDTSERNRQQLREQKAGAAEALSGYFKLAKASNLISNIDLHIKKHFEAAKDEGLVTSEPYAVVGPSVGMFSEPEALRSSEFKFLLNSEHFDLVTDLSLVEERALNLHYLFKKYSELHVELQEWMETVPGFTRKFDGPIATDKFPTEFEGGLHLRAAQLNRILAGIIENLDEDMKFSIGTTQNFIDAAHEKYGPHFPKMTFA